VQDPALRENVVKLGMVQELSASKETGTVTLTLRLPTLAHPFRQNMAMECERELRTLPWVKNVAVAQRARRPASALPAARAGGLANVEHVVAVSSCKGGVGKSTVAVNLAYALAAQGARVGLLDADLYGPSLPSLVNPVDTALRVSDSCQPAGGSPLVTPIKHEGVSLLSFGYVNPEAGVPGAGGRGAAVMRGAMATKVITQLLRQTDWGELDCLIIDMPPGTGDVQITICQAVQLTGAVVVTTPQKLSYVDVVKGLEMFEKLQVPTLALVENMSYFTCEHGTVYRPFGVGKTKELAKEAGVAPPFELPLSRDIDLANSTAKPITLCAPHAPEAAVYHDLAREVVMGMLRAGRIQRLSPTLRYDSRRGIVLRTLSDDSAREYIVPPRELRIRDASTGNLLPAGEISDVPDNVTPSSFEIKGNYAVAITWSDGHSGSIYAYDVVAAVARELEARQL
jgi:Mrp family chromosome partitioning ATPase